MPSPILQARRQGDFVKKYLEQHAEMLLGNFFGLQTHFGSMSIDILVAISDSGIINRPKKMSLDEVCKAEQICDRARSLLNEQQKESSVFNLNCTGRSFNKDEVDKIVKFLFKEHKFLPRKNETEFISKPNSKPSLPEKRVIIQTQAESLSKPKLILSKPSNVIAPLSSEYSCRQCSKTNLFVASGKYGYYFKCLECEGNTPINIVCQNCEIKKKICKRGDRFFAECESCKISDLFYTNPTS